MLLHASFRATESRPSSPTSPTLTTRVVHVFAAWQSFGSLRALHGKCPCTKCIALCILTNQPRGAERKKKKSRTNPTFKWRLWETARESELGRGLRPAPAYDQLARYSPQPMAAQMAPTPCCHVTIGPIGRGEANGSGASRESSSEGNGRHDPNILRFTSRWPAADASSHSNAM